MSQSKIPLYVYVDESGNSGRNLFDEHQPDFYTGAIISKGDFDELWSSKVKKIANSIGHENLHANEIGPKDIEVIAPDLLNLFNSSRLSFFVSRVEKRYLLATKLFDILYDSGENAAVAWHNYNFKPLKIILAMKLGHVVEDNVARRFWDCILILNEDKLRSEITEVCKDIKDNILKSKLDKRSKEVLSEGVDWIIKHPEALQVVNERKITKKGHMPNMVAFTNLLAGLQNFSKNHKKNVAKITHDQQNEFGKVISTWHEMFSNADPAEIEWVGEKYSLQYLPESELVFAADETSAGIQMADLVLWLYSRFLKGKSMGPNSLALITFILRNGWHNDFSYKGVEAAILEEFGEVFFGEIDEAKLGAGRKMVMKSEEARKASMEQYEKDKLPPFMRHFEQN